VFFKLAFAEKCDIRRFIMDINIIVKYIGDFAWGPIMIVFLVGTGLYLTIRMGLIQIRGFKHAWALISGKYDKKEDEGEVTHFQALCTALSATIGTGNIAGVATAIASGGPGAVFWMWVTAVVGMATKFTSCSLSLFFRKVNKDGSVSGGPMYYLEKGLNQKWLGVLFAFFALIASFGIGNMVQANSVAEPLLSSLKIPKHVTGIVIAFLVWLVIIGGIKRIARVASFIVPFMAVVYVLSSLVIIASNFQHIPYVIKLILRHALSPTAAVGGFAGATVAQVIRYGVARGVFSNESGLGSAPMAHAAAKTKYPIREGLVAMLGPFVDTIVICSMTAFVILATGMWTSGETGAVLSASAYNTGLPVIGNYTVTFGLVFFAFSTMLSWSYYGDRCAQYLFGNKAVIIYRWVFVLLIIVGAVVQLEFVWNISDAMNGLMAIPNLIGLLALSGLVARETRKYMSGSIAS
jgi:AGCS family alanine or glycine:cation symporter